MRLLFLTNLYPPHDLGGMEIRCKETVDRLQQRGHAVQVLTSYYGVQAPLLREDGVSRTLYLQADIHHYRPLDFFLRRPWQERANQRELRRALDGFQPDLVFVWGTWNLSPSLVHWTELWMPGRVAHSLAGYLPMEPDVHETYWLRTGRKPWTTALLAPARWLALRILEREKKAHPLALEQVVCVSEYVRSKLDEAGALPHGARVIYNGIDPQPFLQAAAQRKPSQDRLRLVYTGILGAHKGVHTAIDALGMLEAWGEADRLHLTVVGGGHPDYEANLKQRVAEQGLGGLVTFRGRVPRSEIAGILAGNDVFLFTSAYEEPLARTVMEAMATGLAVVGTAVGGQREMLEDGVNALVFPAEDAPQLAECIQRLRRDPALRSRLVQAGRRTVLNRFTLDRMVDEIEVWLEGIVR